MFKTLKPGAMVSLDSIGGHPRITSLTTDNEFIAIELSIEQVRELYRSAGWQLQVLEHEQTTR